MRILGHLAAFTLVCSTLTFACSSTGGDDVADDENTGSLTQALPKPGTDPPDPEPRCVPKCSGKACGAADSCGGTCKSGSCPTGTVCGGGGTPNVCACKASCAGKGCGQSDGCGGSCSDSPCPFGSFCGAGGTPNVCAPIPNGQGVECFVFDDGGAAQAGPTDAIFFNAQGQACMPGNGATGICRKWWGRCRTTDSNHTTVRFANGMVNPFGPGIYWAGQVEGLYSHHYFNFGAHDATEACSDNVHCNELFGNGQTTDGRPVRCSMFEDGYANLIGPVGSLRDEGTSRVINRENQTRKWFGRCKVGGCGDAVCDENETFKSCPSDCTCGNGVCDNGETTSTCATDCKKPPVVKPCGNGVCDNGETYASCPKDCPAPSQQTCNQATPTQNAQWFIIPFEDANRCGYTINAYANSLDEAKGCVTKNGGNVITSGTIAEYEFHTDPTYNCVSTPVTAYSEASAASCAASIGYTYPGFCP